MFAFLLQTLSKPIVCYGSLTTVSQIVYKIKSSSWITWGAWRLERSTSSTTWHEVRGYCATESVVLHWNISSIPNLGFHLIVTSEIFNKYRKSFVLLPLNWLLRLECMLYSSVKQQTLLSAFGSAFDSELNWL